MHAVEMALERYGTPVYVRKQIVHNLHVVRSLERRGAVFVDENADIPPGSVVGMASCENFPQILNFSLNRWSTRTSSSR